MRSSSHSIDLQSIGDDANAAPLATREAAPWQIHFLGRAMPPRLQDTLETWRSPTRGVLVEVGCGGGAILEAALAIPELARRCRVVGIDLSSDRCRMAQAALPAATILQADGARLPLADNSCDLVICDMLIEHMPDDGQLACELARVIKATGLLHLSTVTSTGRGWYWYRRNGRCVLDPTHLREYPSANAVSTLLEQAGFTVTSCDRRGVAYPLIDLVIRGLVACRLLAPTVNLSKLFLRSSLFRWLQRSLIISFHGFESVEVVAHRRTT